MSDFKRLGFFIRPNLGTFFLHRNKEGHGKSYVLIADIRRIGKMSSHAESSMAFFCVL